jgi:hypothetical protein
MFGQFGGGVRQAKAAEFLFKFQQQVGGTSEVKSN